jgi:hypothetical protein
VDDSGTIRTHMETHNRPQNSRSIHGMLCTIPPRNSNQYKHLNVRTQCQPCLTNKIKIVRHKTTHHYLTSYPVRTGGRSCCLQYGDRNLKVTINLHQVGTSRPQYACTITCSGTGTSLMFTSGLRFVHYLMGIGTYQTLYRLGWRLLPSKSKNSSL